MKDFDQLIAQLADDAPTIKPAPHPYSLSLKWIGAATLYIAVSLTVSGVRPDWRQAFTQPWFVAEVATLLVLFIATSLSAALLSFPDLHQKRTLAFAPLWILGLFLVLMLLSWSADNPPAALPEHSFQCTLCIILVALLPTGWTFYAMRNFASTHYRWAGSIAILSAFSVGALWLRLQEVNDSIVHVIEWHYLPMLAVGVVGLWLGKWLLKW